MGNLKKNVRKAHTALTMGLVSLVFCACGPVDLFTGQWESQPGTCQSIGPLPACTEIAIGQFGSDGAGIMRLYLNDAFNVPWPTCPCIHLKDGKKKGDTMTLVADLSLCPNLEGNYPEQLTIKIESLDDFTAALRVEAIGQESSETTIQLTRTADNLVQFDDQYQRECDQSTESGLGFFKP